MARKPKKLKITANRKIIEIVFLTSVITVMGALFMIEQKKEKPVVSYEEIEIKLKEEGLMTAQEAAEICLQRAKNWYEDVEIVRMENVAGVEENGRGDRWLAYIISRSGQTGNRYLIKNGECHLDIVGLVVDEKTRSLPKNWLDSNKALQNAFSQGMMPASKYSMYLGKEENYQKYDQLIWEIHVLATENKEATDGVIIVEAEIK